MIRDNVVKRTRMGYLCLALHYPGNLRLSLGAFQPGGGPSPDALKAMGWGHDAAAGGRSALESGWIER